jgi:hypothetical protein
MAEFGSKEIAAAASGWRRTIDRTGRKKRLQAEYGAARSQNRGGRFSGGSLSPPSIRFIERAIVRPKGKISSATPTARMGRWPAPRGRRFPDSGQGRRLQRGRKIGIARCHDHVSVAMFFAIGLLHLNEISSVWDTE